MAKLCFNIVVKQKSVLMRSGGCLDEIIPNAVFSRPGVHPFKTDLT